MKIPAWFAGKGKTLAIVVGAVVAMLILAGGLYQIRQAITSVDRKVGGVKDKVDGLVPAITAADKKAEAAKTTGATALTLAQANTKAIDATNAKVAKLEKDLAELRQVAVVQLAEHEEMLRGEDGESGLRGDVEALRAEVKKQGRRISALEKVWKKFAPAMKWAWGKWNEPLLEDKSSKGGGDEVSIEPAA